jgi:xanthine dehydrogenase YagS FAD-binding subunit
MRPFEFVAASAIDAARTALAGDGANAIAGGTSLVDLMKLGVERPRTVIDINALPLAAIERVGNDVRIGALVRNSDAAYDALVAESFPVLSQALLAGASAQLRNMATIGGNLMQRTRCTYFRDLHWACNKRSPGSGCAAIEGVNRNHAVLGGSDACVAVHPSDMATALAALDAAVVVAGNAGERHIAFADFHREPGTTPEIETSLAPGELILGVVLPLTPFFRNSAYVKIRDRASYAFALASAAVALDVQGGTIAAARIALGGVATKPWRSAEAEAALVGKPASRATYAAAADAALAGAHPLRDNAHKIPFAKRALVRALETIGGTA